MEAEADRFAAERGTWRHAGGCFIVIEGIDGTGKTTLVGELADRLREQGREVTTSFEPTDGPFGRRIRELAAGGRESVTAEEELQLFMEDRREHLRDRIFPSLHDGRVVILDRYFYSSMAYQGVRGGDPIEIERRHLEFAPVPDLLVILELPVEEALVRIIAGRGEAPNHFEKAEALERSAEVFRSIRHPRLLRLDARQPVMDLASEVLVHMPECEA